METIRALQVGSIGSVNRARSRNPSARTASILGALPRLFLITSVFTCCCSSLPTVRVMPGYSDHPVDEYSLVVAPFHVTIFNKNDLKDDLGPGDPSEVYESFAQPLIVENLRKYSRFGTVVTASYREAYTMHSRRLGGVKSYGWMPGVDEAGSDTSVVIVLPEDGEILRFETGKADFVLLLSSFIVSTKVTTNYVSNYAPPGVPGGGGGYYSSSRELIQQTRFAIWDNRQGRLVAYGSARSTAGVFYVMTDNTWKKGLRDLVKKILNETPFYKGPIRSRRVAIDHPN